MIDDIKQYLRTNAALMTVVRNEGEIKDPSCGYDCNNGNNRAFAGCEESRYWV